MIGLGSGIQGQVYIEPNSATAAAVVKDINPNIQLFTMDYSVTHQGLNDEFFAKIDGVVCAVNNVDGRIYTDELCSRNRKPALHCDIFEDKGCVHISIPG